MNKLTLMTVAALLFAASPAYALSKSQVASIKEALRVPAPELPAKAVQLVKAAPKKDREDVALTAVRTVIAKHPAAAPMVVGAISRELPELSPAVTRAAVAQVPNQRAEIQQAARAAAPAKAAVIDTVTSPAHPAAAGQVALRDPAGQAQATPESVSIRESANHGGSHGTIVVHPGPIRYHRPLPNPPRRPINPPGLVHFGEPRER